MTWLVHWVFHLSKTTQSAFSFLFLFRFDPQDPHLGRPCWWQLLRRRSLLGGKDALSPQGGAIFPWKEKPRILSCRVSSRCPRMRSLSPLCWSTTTTWSTSTRTCKPELEPPCQHHFDPLRSALIEFNRVWSLLLFPRTDPSPTSLWTKVKGCWGEISPAVRTRPLCKMDSWETYKICRCLAVKLLTGTVEKVLIMMKVHRKTIMESFLNQFFNFYFDDVLDCKQSDSRKSEQHNDKEGENEVKVTV